jgi:hypothetical protein
MVVDTPAEEDMSSFPKVVDDGGDSKELIIRIEGSPTQMRSPPLSRSLPPEKGMHPHTSNGTDSLKAEFELVDPMMPTNIPIPEKALGTKDSQLEPPSPLNGTPEKRAVRSQGGSEHVGQTLWKILWRRKNNRKKKELKAYTPDGLDI